MSTGPPSSRSPAPQRPVMLVCTSPACGPDENPHLGVPGRPPPPPRRAREYRLPRHRPVDRSRHGWWRSPALRGPVSRPGIALLLQVRVTHHRPAASASPLDARVADAPRLDRRTVVALSIHGDQAVIWVGFFNTPGNHLTTVNLRDLSARDGGMVLTGITAEQLAAR